MFAEPHWLLALVALPSMALGALVALRRDRERVALLVARPLWSRVVRAPAEHWRWLRLGLLLLGVAGVVLALARPQWGVVRERVEREGVDVVLVLDTSGSMATADVQPNRFFLARAALLSLVSQLDQDRFALVAFEGEAYPLVPLTLDADAVGLFLETLEPGFVPGPGSALGLGLEKGLELFVDEGRRNKVMVLVSDGENLEGEVAGAVEQAREAGVVIHTVGVGTEQGQPVPDFDAQGQQLGFKKDERGQVVVSRLDPRTLERIAGGTGGRYFQIRPSDSSLRPLAAAIDELEDRALAREFAYRKKDRFQVPLGMGLAALTLGLLVPLPGRRSAAATLALLLGGAALPAHAQPAPGATPAAPAPPPAEATAGDALLGELMMLPPRLTREGLRQLETGDHPGALESFERAAELRGSDPLPRFNLAGGLYRNGRFDDAAAIYEKLGAAPDPSLAGAARYNRGNALYERQDYPGAIEAYRSALELLPDDEDVRRNLELALRRLQEQERQEQEQQQQQQQEQDQQEQQDQGQGQDDEKQQQQQQQQQDQQSGEDEQRDSGEQQPREGEQQQDESGDQRQPQPQPGDSSGRPPSAEQRERQRFEEEAGMPRERAMQLLDALQQNEKEEQKKVLASRRKKKKGKDW
jgi:Ca-activated chloride channel family protein